VKHSQSYSRQRQSAYFAAAREHYRIAASILDDAIEDTELLGSTDQWVRDMSKRTMDKGRELEGLGHEECVAGGHAEAALSRARLRHSKALDRYLARKAAAERKAVAV